MVVLEYGRPNGKLSRKLIVTGILLCACIAVLAFRGWRRGPVPVATVSPPTTSAVAPTYLILRTQDLNSAVFHCPPVQPTTREVAGYFSIVKAKDDGAQPVFSVPSSNASDRAAIDPDTTSFAKPQAAEDNVR